MYRKIQSAVLGTWTFFASPHAIDVCGINGLPLTPNSVRILGQFQKLKILEHEQLCSYLDVQRGKHERVMIVSEHYLSGLHEIKMRLLMKDINVLVRTIFEIVDALSYLHSQGIVHRCLCPSSIRFDSEGHVKLSNYGLYYMTEGGSTVSFPIGVPKYMAPEVLARGLHDISSSSKCDIWSLGIILLDLIMEEPLWVGLELEEIFKEVFSLVKLENGSDVLSSLLEKNNAVTKFEALPNNLQLFISECLNVLPHNRPDPQYLLLHPVFVEYGMNLLPRSHCDRLFLSTQLKCNKPMRIDQNSLIDDHLAERPLQEVYYLWQLAGGDLEAELRRQELIRAKPPIVTISKIVAGEGEEFGHEKDCAYLLDDSVLVLPLEPLKHRLRDVDPDIYYPLIEYSLNGITPSHCLSTLNETAKLPLVIKEKDVEYQLHRIILFKRLLEAYPYKRSQILHEAKVDIPPLYRPLIWAALLEIEGNIQETYDSIDKETPTPTDRQIEVDIPRCHQYDELLSSPAGHLKFKRILKAWIVSHPQYVYWQGLDSLCAPFLSLNFNDEEYLAKFSHLIAYHDPELTNHLDNIGFIPELYAIPWFLTMYTHVFPLHKIFHLWDTLLLGHSSFPLCIGVSILKQLRNNLLSYGFNECILMFSDMPEIDIQRCVQDSIKIFCSTPKSITYRVHENPSCNSKLPFDTNLKLTKEETVGDPDLMMSPVPLSELKSEMCPRISAEDLLDFLDLLPESKKRTKPQNIKLLVVDIRSPEEFCKGSLLKSINIPFNTAFAPDGTIDNTVLTSFKGKMITVIGSNKDKLVPDFATKLVKCGYSQVCTLHGGVEVLRKTGMLIAKTSES
ncbi:TBC domain-containing protein kinase-like protein isoform X2 [Stegodyphus dumicola]|uniref:TBC domain-containing protein kinase-like protein isoform X2 n=1 Tax=Stegodyphus dumicola TaxID=202533 RepID=UPI0015ADE328|nr:TBC domain-containing protein kinase-like protein isoform X2 [Stegodyphus dumicola]